MKILLSVHLYPPQHMAGGEQYLHNIAKYLITKGHKVRVLLNEAQYYNIKKVYSVDEVEVYPRGRNIEEHFIWADRVITHLGFTSWTVSVSHIFRKPVFFVVHNTHPYSCVSDTAKRVGIIYNCETAKKMLQYPQPNIVMPPPVDWRLYDMGFDTSKNPYITLVNLNENKGGRILYDIARAMPDKQFLAVKGAYDPQIIEHLPNVHFMDNTPDVLEVYKQTRILIMPSEYESWGMCATEAMANGIPVICTPTFGLKENCGDAGIYIGKEPEPDENGKFTAMPKVTGRDDIAAWVREIRKLDNKKTYLSQSNRCRDRSRMHDPKNRYEELEQFLIAG